jgi:hypothetical protein
MLMLRGADFPQSGAAKNPGRFPGPNRSNAARDSRSARIVCRISIDRLADAIAINIVRAERGFFSIDTSVIRVITNRIRKFSNQSGFTQSVNGAKNTRSGVMTLSIVSCLGDAFYRS